MAFKPSECTITLDGSKYMYMLLCLNVPSSYLTTDRGISKYQNTHRADLDIKWLAICREKYRFLVLTCNYDMRYERC